MILPIDFEHKIIDRKLIITDPTELKNITQLIQFNTFDLTEFMQYYEEHLINLRKLSIDDCTFLPKTVKILTCKNLKTYANLIELSVIYDSCEINYDMIEKLVIPPTNMLINEIYRMKNLKLLQIMEYDKEIIIESDLECFYGYCGLGSIPTTVKELGYYAKYVNIIPLSVTQLTLVCQYNIYIELSSASITYLNLILSDNSCPVLDFPNLKDLTISANEYFNVSAFINSYAYLNILNIYDEHKIDYDFPNLKVKQLECQCRNLTIKTFDNEFYGNLNNFNPNPLVKKLVCYEREPHPNLVIELLEIEYIYLYVNTSLITLIIPNIQSLTIVSGFRGILNVKCDNVINELTIQSNEGIDINAINVNKLTIKNESNNKLPDTYEELVIYYQCYPDMIHNNLKSLEIKYGDKQCKIISAPLLKKLECSKNVRKWIEVDDNCEVVITN